ncbi:MAG: glycosyltransferase family 4 protein [bacterium]|nr:glycosyltransferase family 4 protein [bacterium]
MKVVYILNGSALYGGVKVVYQHARALRRLGVDAEVVSPEPPSTWFDGVEAFYRQVEGTEPECIGPADIAVGTIYFTVPVATRVEGARAAHLCQCYEGMYEPARDDWPRIDAVYRLPAVKLAVSPHLVELIGQRFDQPCHWIPQPLEHDLFYPPAPDEPRGDRFRVLISGQWSLDVKGVERALRALRPLARETPPLELVRLSQDAPKGEVAFWPEAERHVQLPPARVPELVRSIDLYVGVPSEVEGFGLSALEAMSCGRPAILSDIGATRCLDPHDQAAVKVPFGDAESLRRAVRRLRDRPDLRRRLGAAGRRIASGFSEERTGRTLVTVFEGILDPDQRNLTDQRG